MEKLDNELMEFEIRKKQDIRFILNLLQNKKVTKKAIERHMNTWLLFISCNDCVQFLKYCETKIEYSDKMLFEKKYLTILDCVNSYIKIRNNRMHYG
tara:strand:+ start:566 stop:856 length:291 start_codon:yes stop_codon:yes gene_type:complete